MCNFGLCYEAGIGVKKNEIIAFDWFQKAVDAGNMDAVWYITKYYRAGIMVKKNKITVFDWFQKAADA